MFVTNNINNKKSLEFYLFGIVELYLEASKSLVISTSEVVKHLTMEMTMI